jgi:hypothetical protein
MALRKNRLVVIIVVLAIFGLLAITNPSSADFKKYLSESEKKSAEVETGSAMFGKVAGALAGLGSGMYDRTSYGLFSVFSVGKGSASYIGFGKVVFVRIR